MRSAAMSTPVTITTSNKTSVKTYVTIGAVGFLGFAAAMFMAALQPGSLAIDVTHAVEVNTAVEGQTSVPMLGLTMSARKQDVQIDSLTFDMAAEADGDLSSLEGGLIQTDYVSGCSLYEQGIANPLASAVPTATPTDSLTFSALGLVIAQNTHPKFEVTCDFSNPAIEHATPYAFALKISSDASIAATEVMSGTVLTADRILAGLSDTGVNTDSGNAVNLFEHGTVNIGLSPVMPASDILLPNVYDFKGPGPEVGAWTMTARGEDMAINTLSFSMNADYSRDVNTATATVDVDGVITSDTVTVSGQTITFENLASMLTKNTTATVTLTITPKPSLLMLLGSGVSGDNISFALTAVNPGDFLATGVTTGALVDETDLSVIQGAKANFVYRNSRPTLLLMPASPSGASTPGLHEVLRFSNSADLMGDIGIDDLTFAVTATDTAGTAWNSCDPTLAAGLTAADFSIYNLSGAGLAASLDTADTDWTLYDADGNVCGAGSGPLAYARVHLPSVLHIAAMHNATLAVYVDTTGASSALDDTFRLDIPATANNVNGLIWEDGSAQNITGRYVKNLPLTGGTLTY